MATDLFTNPSRNYVHPVIAPCANAASDLNLEFVKDGIGIVSGPNVITKIDFSSISIPVNSYSTESKIIKQQIITYKSKDKEIDINIFFNYQLVLNIIIDNTIAA